MKRKKTGIEIANGANVDEIFEKVQAALGMTFAHNLDALHDVLSEYGDGVTMTFKNGDKVPENVRKVFDDLQNELEGFSVVFLPSNLPSTKTKKDKRRKRRPSC